MSLLTFKGGIHPPHSKKATEKLPVVDAVYPSVVTIPLRQHIGAPTNPIVKKGDLVKVGQVIGEATSFVCSPVHSSVSGVVKDVKVVEVAGGSDLCVIIEADGKDELHESVVPKGTVEDLSGKEILEIIKDAGIVGMGGAGFPTHVKLSPPPEKKIDVVILNGAECEPYLTCDHRLMLEDPEMVVYGLRAILKSLNIENGYIGIENNKPDAIESMKKAAKAYPNIKVVGLETKYPQGAEKQLIYACTKREVPSGGLPMDAGAVVNNIATAAAVGRAIKEGMPLVERICTVTGVGIKAPKNLRIKVGTNIKEIIDQCEGYNGEPGKLIMGGPMMGLAQSTDNIPSTKTTSGILVFSKEQAVLSDPAPCMKCAKCVGICPAGLEPLFVAAHSVKRNYEQAEAFGALDCIECGSCSFVCPSKRPLLHSIRMGKREIIAQKRKKS